MLLWIILLSFFQTAEVPYKPNDEFEVKIDYQIKPRPYSPQDADPKIDFSPNNNGLPETRRKAGSFPHIAFKVKFFKLSEQEVKVRISDQADVTVYQRKAKEGAVIDLEMGFIKDIKEGIVSREYTIELLSSDKRPTSRVFIVIQKDGAYLVNGIVCGKF